MSETTASSPLPQRDYLDTFILVLRDAMIRNDGAHRAAKKLDRLRPITNRRAGSSFVRRIRDFGLLAFDQIATNHATRHGLQKPWGDHDAIVRWLCTQIESAPKREQYHLARAVQFADAILTNHRRGSGYPCATDHALCEIIVTDAAELFALLAASTRLDYGRLTKHQTIVGRFVSGLRRDEVNFGWEQDVLGRLCFLNTAHAD